MIDILLFQVVYRDTIFRRVGSKLSHARDTGRVDASSGISRGCVQSRARRDKDRACAATLCSYVISR